MEKVAFIVPCRDKEHYIAQNATSVLRQTFPMEILFSDQGSTDASLSILRDVVSKYDGKHNVRLLQCPHTDVRGMAGLNAHMRWLHDQTDADIIMMTSADDWVHPRRTERCVAAFRENDADMVATAIEFWEPPPNYSVTGITAHQQADGWLDPRLCLDDLVGGSTAHAWTRDFYEAVGGTPDICGYDVFWPFLATARKGCWFIQEPLHAYIRWVAKSNTGLEGIHRASDLGGQKQCEELMHFQTSYAFWKAAQCLDVWGNTDPRIRQPLYENILGRSNSWSKLRWEMTLQNIEPVRLVA